MTKLSSWKGGPVQVNFTTDEYEVLKYLADMERKWPAALVHDWMMDMAYATARRLLKAQQEGRGCGDGSAETTTSLPSCTPLPVALDEMRAEP
jgi:hypothetical protein